MKAKKLSKIEALAKLDELLASLIGLLIRYGELKAAWEDSEYKKPGEQSKAMADIAPRIASHRAEIQSLYALLFPEDVSAANLA